MSGRPVRNCKRRTAAEMLGMSPSTPSPKKSVKSAATPTRSAKKAKIEKKEVEVEQENLADKSELLDELLIPLVDISTRSTRTSRRGAAKNSSTDKTEKAPAPTKTPQKKGKSAAYTSKRKSPAKAIPKEADDEPESEEAIEAAAEDQQVTEATAESGDMMESAVEAEESVLDDPSISDEPATDQDIERVELQEVMSSDVDSGQMDIMITEARTESEAPVSDDIMVSHDETGDNTDDVTADVTESMTADAGGDTTEPQTVHITTSGGITQTLLLHHDQETDEITLMDPRGDCTTLPELDSRRDMTMIPDATDHILTEDDIITLQSEEVCLTEPLIIEPASPVKVTFPKSKPPGAPKQPMVITAENLRQKMNQTAVAKKMLEKGVRPLSLESKRPVPIVHKTAAATVTTSLASDGGFTQREEQAMNLIPVTKTYIVGKDNKIQEIIMKNDDQLNAPTASNTDITVMDSTVEEDAVGEDTEVMAHEGVDLKSEPPQAGESDDEEFEYEDEDTRLQLEGFDMDDDMLLIETTTPGDGYIIDSTLCSLFEGIKAAEKIEDHYNYWEGSGFRCNHCEASPPTRRAFMCHLRTAHFSEFAPWQCPICQYKCLYPAALMLHLNMHTNNTPYACGKCNKKFAYQRTLQNHVEHHSRDRPVHCEQCPLYFHTEETHEIHRQRKHLSNRVLYVGDNRAIVQETIADNEDLDLLDNSTGDGGRDGESQTLKMTEMGLEALGTSSNGLVHVDSSKDLQEMINTASSMVQIMPVSFRNEQGLPETINVVITVPQDQQKNKPAILANSLKAATSGFQGTMTSGNNYNYRGGRTNVDKELLPYCEILNAPIHYNNQKAFIKCKVCDPPNLAVHFSSVTQFCDHLRKDHAEQDIKPYACDKCDYKCKVKGNLDQHMKFHATERPFVCAICNKGFIQKYKLNLHLKFHENKREHRCEECGSSFNDKQDLTRHKRNVHFSREEGVPCPHCERVFKNQYMLEEHIHIHTGEKRYKCEMCEKLYSTRESLRSHMKGHQFQFGCEICAKPLGSYSAFIAHKRLHDPNQKGYPCTICGKVMLFKATLESHMKSVHSDEKDFDCDQCSKKFKTPGQLRNHMISHTKEKPYLCQICGYAVKRKDSLRQHMYRHAEVKPYRCGRCGKEYTQKQALEIHLKAKHAGVTTFNCTMCEKGFNTNYLLKKHMQKAHEVDLVERAPRSDQVIIAQQEVEEAADCEPPAPEERGVVPPTSKKQTVLINAHICEHCHEVFVSQHALAVHILSEHMSQGRVGAVNVDDASNIPTHAEDGQVVNISETIEIPIGEEMVLVQSVEPGLLSEAIEKGGGTRVMSSAPQTRPASSAPKSTVSLLQNKSVVVSSSGAEDENGVTVSVLETTIDASEGTEIVTEEATEVTVNTEMVVQDEEGKIVEVDTSGQIVEEEVITE